MLEKDFQAIEEASSALKIEHPALQNMNFLNFFLLLWVIFAFLNPDPDSLSYGSTDLIVSGSETLGTTSRKMTNVFLFCTLSYWLFRDAGHALGPEWREAPVHPGPCRHHQRSLLLSQQVSVRLLFSVLFLLFCRWQFAFLTCCLFWSSSTFFDSVLFIVLRVNC